MTESQTAAVIDAFGFSGEQLDHVRLQIGGVTPEPYRTYPDGTAMWVYVMTFGKGRLCIGHVDDRTGFARGFCYETLGLAFRAADEWDGSGEPTGWFRCLQTGRRRPGGDPAKEYVNP